MIEHEFEQRSEEWFKLRLDIPTGSNFAKIVTGTGKFSEQIKTYAITLANQSYAGKSLEKWTGNQWTERGKEMEEEAMDWYGLIYSPVEKVGFVTDDDITHGVSPDGKIGKKGTLEMKCLKPEEHTKVLIYYDKHGKCEPKYIPQTQGEIMVTEREWCDLLFYHPDLPKLVIRQEADLEFHAKLKEGIGKVILERDRILNILRRY